MEDNTKLELEVSKVENAPTEKELIAAAVDEVRDPSLGPKPTDEEIEDFKKDFVESYNDFNSKLWQIGTEENAEQIINYLEHFIKYRFQWSKNEWMGVIKIKEELDIAKTKLTDKKLFELGHQALEFAYYAIGRPGGTGLESAEIFEKENVEFGLTFGNIEEAVFKCRKALKEVQWKQERYASSIQGFFLAPLEPEEEPQSGLTKVEEPSLEKIEETKSE